MSSWAGYGNQYMQLPPEQSSKDIAPLQQILELQIIITTQ